MRGELLASSAEETPSCDALRRFGAKRQKWPTSSLFALRPTCVPKRVPQEQHHLLRSSMCSGLERSDRKKECRQPRSHLHITPDWERDYSLLSGHLPQKSVERSQLKLGPSRGTPLHLCYGIGWPETAFTAPAFSVLAASLSCALLWRSRKSIKFFNSESVRRRFGMFTPLYFL